jgi:acetylornithine deacetylase
VTLFELTKELVNIPSVTGDEAAVAEFVSGYLRRNGFDVSKQPVIEHRRNILATFATKPRVILCTHMDTVPPFIPADEDADYIYGRGSCDAKGILAAMITAGIQLRELNVQDFGLLFLVGEETDSIGAKTSNALHLDSDFIIVGEPTENKLGVGHKGLVAARISTKGKAAHSAVHEIGESAINKLLDILEIIRKTDWGRDVLLGKSSVNIGTLAGGVAHNVVSAEASAQISIRITVASEKALATLNSATDGRAEIEIITRAEPQKLFTLPDFEQTVLPYGTDIPHLKNFGKPLLVGPGTIKVAHTPDERIAKKDLTAAVEIYVKLVQKLLAN